MSKSFRYAFYSAAIISALYFSRIACFKLDQFGITEKRIKSTQVNYNLELNDDFNPVSIKIKYKFDDKGNLTDHNENSGLESKLNNRK